VVSDYTDEARLRELAEAVTFDGFWYDAALFVSHGTSPQNAAFIEAASPTAVLSLLARVAAQDTEITELTDQRNALRGALQTGQYDLAMDRLAFQKSAAEQLERANAAVVRAEQLQAAIERVKAEMKQADRRGIGVSTEALRVALAAAVEVGL
jgi:chromosome segregation ATPase